MLTIGSDTHAWVRNGHQNVMEWAIFASAEHLLLFAHSSLK
jgi:hypothetical protein